MKKVYLFLTLSFGVACSSTPKPVSMTPYAADPAVVKKYTQTMVPMRMDAASRINCPATVPNNSPWSQLASAANACAKQGQWAKVEIYGNELAKREVQSPWGPYYLSLAATERHEFPRAQWMLQLAMKKAPNVGLFEYQRARLSYLSRDINGATEGFQKALKLDSSLYEANLFLGQIYFRDQDFDQAITHFQNVLAIDANNAFALSTMAEVYVQKNDAKRAIETYGRAIDAYPGELKYRVRTAEIFEKLNNDPASALSVYRQITLLMETKRIHSGNPTQIREKIKTLELAVHKLNPKKGAPAERHLASPDPKQGAKL